MKAIYNLVRKLHSEVILLSILFLFFFETLNSFLTNVYALNFAIMGIGPYALLSLFLLSPLILLIFREKTPVVGIYLSSGLLVISRILLLVISDVILLSFIAGIGVAGFGVFLPTYLVRRDEGPAYLTTTQALAIAIGLSIALKSIGSSIDFSMYGHGRVICCLLAAIVILMIAGVQTQKEGKEVAKKERMGKILVLSMGLYGTLAIEWFVLAYPSVLSRWSDSPYAVVSVIAMLVVASFVTLITIIPQIFEQMKTWMIVTLNALLVISVMLVAVLPQVGAMQKIFTYATAMFSPVALLDFMLLIKEVNRLKPSPRQLGGSFGISSLLFLALIFAMIFSFNYEFVPGMSILRDRMSLIILLTLLMVVVPVALVKGIGRIKGLKKPLRKLPQKNKIIALALTGLFIVGTGVGLGINATTPDVPPPPKTLRVMSFNLHQGEDVNGQFNFARVLETIKKSDADIIGLQETEMARVCFGNNDLVRFLAEKLNMHSYYGPKTITGTYGVAMLSKFPIEFAETLFMPSEDSQRVIIKSKIRVGTEVITVYNTHFGLSLEERIAHAKFTADLTADSDRAILLGDFNTNDLTKAPYTIITSKFRDGWLEINPSGIDEGGYDGATFDWQNPTERIDYIFFTPDLRITDFDVLTWAHESDHMPIVAVFSDSFLV